VHAAQHCKTDYQLQEDVEKDAGENPVDGRVLDYGRKRTGMVIAPLPAESQAANLTHDWPLASNGISKW
jgi:hypothetical protein